MTKKELYRQGVIQRTEERRIAKEKRDLEKAEKARQWAAKKEMWAQKRKEERERIELAAQYKELIIQRKHEAVFDDTVHFLETKIPKAIRRGDTNQIINDSLFFEIRNASFALASSIKYMFKLISQGDVKEHVNGRTNIGIYGAYLVLTGKITNWEDLYNFLLRFGCWIETSKKFNDYIARFQNENDGAISPEVYIREYEKFFNYKLSDTERSEFSKRFLFTEYGVITKDMIVNNIREKMQK